MLGRFLKALFTGWINRMSSGIGVILTFVGAFVPEAIKSWVWGSVVVALCISCFRAWYGPTKELDTLKERLTGFPRITLAEHGNPLEVLATSVKVTPSGGPYFSGAFFVVELGNMLRLRIQNRPYERTNDSVAKSITANISFYTATGAHCGTFPARWSDSPNPPDPKQDSTVARAVDFPVEYQRTLDVALKDKGAMCRPYNNDSCLGTEHSPLPEGRIRVVVQIDGAHVDTRVTFWFTHENGGPFNLSHPEIDCVNRWTSKV